MFGFSCNNLLFWTLSTLVVYAWAIPAEPAGVPHMKDHTGVAVDVPHSKRIACEINVHEELPKRETSMVGVTRDVSPDDPCYE